MENFYDVTGIEPYIYICEQSEIKPASNPYYYSPLSSTEIEDYALELYTQRYSDEGHWLILIVHSAYNDEICDMAGDDTNKIITQNVYNDFVDKITTYSNDISFSSIAVAFESLSSTVMTVSDEIIDTQIGLCIVGGITIIIAIIIGVYMYKFFKTMNDYCDYKIDHPDKETVVPTVEDTSVPDEKVINRGINFENMNNPIYRNNPLYQNLRTTNEEATEFPMDNQKQYNNFDVVGRRNDDVMDLPDGDIEYDPFDDTEF